MKKWLFLLVLLAGAIAGILWWLGASLEDEKPDSGEVRLEIESVL